MTIFSLHLSSLAVYLLLAFTMKCTLDHEGHVVFFTGDNVNVNSEKAVLAEWNPGKEECKFKLVVNFVVLNFHA